MSLFAASRFRIIFALSVLSMVCWSTTGCGGGGGTPNPDDPTPTPTPTFSPTPTPTPAPNATGRAQLTINWPARSRSVNAPSSALSAKVSFIPANGAAPTVWTINRTTGRSEAFSQTETAPVEMIYGMYTVNIEFFAEAGLAGQRVATAATAATLQQGGTTLPDINFTGSVSRVEILPNQSVGLYETKPLAVSALAADGSPLAVSAGSFTHNIISGSEALELRRGDLYGKANGIAQVVATVDGISSASTKVTVGNTPTLNFTGQATIEVGESAMLTWYTADASRVESTFGATTLQGNQSVTPNTTTKYSMAAFAANGLSSQKDVTITVEPRSPTLLVSTKTADGTYGIQRYSSRTGRSRSQFGSLSDSTAQKMAVAPDGSIYYAFRVGTANAKAVKRVSPDGTLLQTLPAANSTIQEMVVLPNGQLLVYTITDEFQVYSKDGNTISPEFLVRTDGSKKYTNVYDMKVGPDGKLYLAVYLSRSGSMYGVVRAKIGSNGVVTLENEPLMFSGSGTTFRANGLAFLSDGLLAIANTESDQVEVYNVNTGQRVSGVGVNQLEDNAQIAVARSVFATNDEILYVRCNDGVRRVRCENGIVSSISSGDKFFGDYYTSDLLIATN